jgi:hypothetical protein
MSRISLGAVKFRQLLQRGYQNCFVARAVMRWTKSPAYRMIDEDSSRRCDFAHDVQGGADYQSWNAARFDDVSDETDGLVAKGSIGHEQGEIHRQLL